jgi:hypothetical protein
LNYNLAFDHTNHYLDKYGWETTLKKEEEHEILNLEDEHRQPKHSEDCCQQMPTFI